MAEPPIYLDYAAATPVDKDVVEAMVPYFSETFGNAASRSHAFGWAAEEAVNLARERVAEVLGAGPKEVVFTSGATEANNLALKGVARAYASKGRHVVTVETEHKAVLDPCRALEGEGFEVTRLGVDGDGLVDVDAFAATLRDDTVLASVMYANNETGVLQPIRELGHACRRRGVLFHTDAAQAFAKVPMSVEDDALDLVSVSAHKVYGPKGVGALYVRRRNPRVQLVPLIDGGGHERGHRSGTVNVPGIVGLGAAAALAGERMHTDVEQCRALRDHIEARLRDELDGVVFHGHRQSRLPGHVSVGFEGVEGDGLLLALPGVAMSSGAACTSASLEPSHVLRAMRIDDALAHGSIRITVGRPTTRTEVDAAVDRISDAVRRLRRETTQS